VLLQPSVVQDTPKNEGCSRYLQIRAALFGVLQLTGRAVRHDPARGHNQDAVALAEKLNCGVWLVDKQTTFERMRSGIGRNTTGL
jgi:hypothetical protein